MMVFCDPQVVLGGVFEYIYQNQLRLGGYGPWEHGDLRGYFFIHKQSHFGLFYLYAFLYGV